MAPSQLQIATSALQRLVKEEASYYREIEQQQARIAKLEAKNGTQAGGDGNEEYELRQEVRFPSSLSQSGSNVGFGVEGRVAREWERCCAGGIAS